MASWGYTLRALISIRIVVNSRRASGTCDQFESVAQLQGVRRASEQRATCRSPR